MARHFGICGTGANRRGEHRGNREHGQKILFDHAFSNNCCEVCHYNGRKRALDLRPALGQDAHLVTRIVSIERIELRIGRERAA